MKNFLLMLLRFFYLFCTKVEEITSTQAARLILNGSKVLAAIGLIIGWPEAKSVATVATALHAFGELMGMLAASIKKRFPNIVHEDSEESGETKNDNDTRPP